MYLNDPTILLYITVQLMLIMKKTSLEYEVRLNTASD